MEKPDSHISNWAIPEKNQTGGGRVDDMEFPGVSKK